MAETASVFHLKVQRVEQVCLFELSWGRGQQLNATLPYPETLSVLYQEWNSGYLNFYNTALRGRVVENNTGMIAPPPVDWHAKLVQAEAKLLYEFHQWLRNGDLYEIRARIAQAVRDGEKGRGGEGKRGRRLQLIDIFLTCNPLELERLPWEAWEIGTEFATAGRIWIVRKPINIQGTTGTVRKHRGRARVLAILGDDTGLNFEADRQAVKSLSAVAEIQFVGWQPKKNIEALKTEIVEAITNEQGWDILFFAGHSNETILTGGELAIAPGVSLFLKEIEQPLLVAKERGLQFALFNSCKGLSLANALINLGLSQVAVMREPIHNQVAQEFLLRFLQRLAEYEDVHESLLAACRYLKLDKQFSYPSAYLVPSLFRHPDAPLFRLEPFGFKHQLKRWLPTKREAIALSLLALVSCSLSVQNILLERRVLSQAVYRHWTGQVPQQTPPLLLVHIDDQSIIEAGIKDPNPMDREYLAKLVNKLSTLKAKVVGIDYLLDRPHGERNNSQENSPDGILAQSLEKAVQQQQTWFVFAAVRDSTEQWVGVLPEIASLNWSLQGNSYLFHWRERLGYMRLVPPKDASSRNLPFAYLMALAYRLNLESAYSPPQPQLQPKRDDFLSQLVHYLGSQHKQDYTTFFSPSSRLHPVTRFAYGLGQMWLHPIIDFSIPPDQVYQRIPAWEFLQMTSDSPQLNTLNQQAVMIAAGGYGQNPGVEVGGNENDLFHVPAAINYWRTQRHFSDPRRIFTGGEAHAYVFHNFLTRRAVVPLPNLWVIAIAALLGKGTALLLAQPQYQSRRWVAVLLVSVTAAYGVVGLQVYIWGAVLLPWLFPSLTFWTFVLPILIGKKYHA